MKKPLLSVIVIAYDMPRQALNTLLSFAPGYQQGVDADDYEVIVVENRSARNMNAAEIDRLPGNFHYFLRDEKGVSPAAAINFGVEKAKGKFIGLLIDGARMVTPGVIRHALMSFRMTDDALVLVPGYHLGENEQQFNLEHGYNEEVEKELLDGVDWRNNGYRLFDISCNCGANRNGFFHPFLECNCLFVSKEIFTEIGGADERFDMPGGGALNLYIYYKLATHQDTEVFLLAGEGSFHQIHGGVTTSSKADREDLLEKINNQLSELLGHPFRSPTVEFTLLGKFRGPALRYLKFSVERGIRRFGRLDAEGRDPYDDDRKKRKKVAV
ncbi:glycosyltransferase [Parvibaculum sp.]|uniref:glycosyltransferase n=1 Tax=Parvibaculum sp. TaxID=2024848 RepID=UPI003BABED0C